MITADQALDDLDGVVCKGCGGKKSCGKSLCGKCYFRLPNRLRSALYQRVGRGYEQAYTASLDFLSGIE